MVPSETESDLPATDLAADDQALSTRASPRSTQVWDPPALTVAPSHEEIARQPRTGVTAGRVLFSTKINTRDGAGRPSATGDSKPTLRARAVEQQFSRISGPDANSCAGCHNEPMPPSPTDLLGIMQTQREDLALLRTQLDETIKTFRVVIPLAEKNQFVPMMLSGRAGFSSKVQQSVDMLGEFSRYYSRTCMATIEATMQAYPAGFEWLPKVPDDLGPTPPPNRQPVPDEAPPPSPVPDQKPVEQKQKNKDCSVGNDASSPIFWLAVFAFIAWLGTRRRRSSWM